MKPPHTHLTCRAPNRFSPSALLWQHFVAAYRPVLHHHRLSSTAAEPAPNGAHGDHGVPNRPEASGSTKLVDAARGKDAQPKTPTLRIMKQKTHNGTWKFTKAEASISKNAEKGHQQRLDSLTAPDQILASAKAAFEGGKDYDGVVVPPMESPISCPEKRLPWCLAINERTMAGVDRLAVEIERFYDFAKPDHLEALARRHLIEQVRDHVRQILPNHILEVFGSERTGLAMATSDIDLRLLLKEQLENPADPKLPPKPEQRTEAMKHMHKLHFNGLSKNKAYKLALLRYARYPLIALQDNQSGLDVQIVLSNDTSVSREIMTGYMEQYPYLRQLYCVVKTMFDVRGLSDVFRGGFGSYSLFMMVVASIKHSPNPRKDAAGGLINFLRFYQKLNTEKWGISIEPVWLFDKTENPVITEKTRAKMQEGTAKPLPPYMLCLRDPADETNDLGRKAIAIKHVQATFKRLSNDLFRNMAQNTRYSLLGPLVGSSYMLNKERRENVRQYGAQLSKELKASLAAKARMVKERERENKESPAEWAQARIARRARESEWRRVSEERNKKLRAEAGRTAILEHGDAISSILGMPSVEGDEQSEKSPIAYTSVDEASQERSTTDRGPIKYSPSEEGKSGSGAASTTQDAQKIPSE